MLLKIAGICFFHGVTLSPAARLQIGANAHDRQHPGLFGLFAKEAQKRLQELSDRNAERSRGYIDTRLNFVQQLRINSCGPTTFRNVLIACGASDSQATGRAVAFSKFTSTNDSSPYEGFTGVNPAALFDVLASVLSEDGGYVQRDKQSKETFSSDYHLTEYLLNAFNQDKFNVVVLGLEFEGKNTGHFVLAIRSPERHDDIKVAIVDPAMHYKQNWKVLRELAIEMNTTLKDIPFEYLPNVAAHPQDIREFFHDAASNIVSKVPWSIKAKNMLKVMCPQF